LDKIEDDSHKDSTKVSTTAVDQAALKINPEDEASVINEIPISKFK
jgi:hypothetical protein